MKKVGIVLAVIAIIPLVVSCAAPKEAVKGTGEGATDIVEGAGRGVTDLGKETVETVKETAEATGQFLTGQGEGAIESGKGAIDAGASGVKAIIVEPVEGLEKGLKAIDEGIKKAIGTEEVK